MQDAAERLKFAVQFSQLDLDNLRPGDWMNLRDDLVQFIFGPHARWVQEFKELDEVIKQSPHDVQAQDRVMLRHLREPKRLLPPLPNEYPEDDFRSLQEDVRMLLRSLVGRRDQTLRGIRSVPIAVYVTVLIVPPMEGKPERRMLTPTGPTRDVFLWILSHLLEQGPTNPIRKCPECDTIFYRIRKQQYCSRTCVTRAGMRKWRQTETGKRYERARSQTRYEAQAKRRTSLSVKVGRRAQSKERKQGE
jgi:hypothetical protein